MLKRHKAFIVQCIQFCVVKICIYWLSHGIHTVINLLQLSLSCKISRSVNKQLPKALQEARRSPMDCYSLVCYRFCLAKYDLNRSFLCPSKLFTYLIIGLMKQNQGPPEATTIINEIIL